MTKQSKTNLIVAIVIILLGFFGWLVYSKRAQLVQNNTGATNAIESFVVERPNLVARGNNSLVRVEIWGVPLKTNVTESEHLLLGNASKGSATTITATVWTLPIPQTPMSLSDIYAKGYDQSGKLIAKKSLELSGTSSIYEALWLDMSRKDLTLGVGEVGTAETITLKLLKITEDSRCPVDVQCIQAGRVAVDVEISNTTDKKLTKLNLKSNNDPYEYGGYFIEISNVEPVKKPTETITQDEYKITFTITKDVKL